MRRSLLLAALMTTAAAAAAQVPTRRPAAPAATTPVQAAPPPAASPAPANAPPATPEPQRTTATFGDWTLICVKPDKAPQACELAQTLANNGTPVARTAIGRPGPGQPLHFGAVVPVNVQLTTPPRLVGAEKETGFTPLELTWRRCIPSGCYADATVAEEMLRTLQTRTENARVVFQDASGHEAALPVGPRGLAQALESLGKEDQSAQPR